MMNEMSKLYPKIKWGRSFCKVYLCYCIEDGKTELYCQPVLRGLFDNVGIMHEFGKRLSDAFGEVFDSMSDEERAELKAELLKGYEERP
ncbi:MAG: hypothetical protein PHC52_12950 [Syntrophales bacterium]|nr:hypothetical protein [Syntrophales bacterium]